MQNGAFDPYAARAAYDRQLLGILRGFLMIIAALGVFVYMIHWIMSQTPNGRTVPMFDKTPPTISRGCLDNPNVQVYQAFNFANLYTTGGGELCAWEDGTGLHLVTELEHVLDQREGYLRQKYRGQTFACEQPPRKKFFGGHEAQPPTSERWKMRRYSDTVCIIACGITQDCGEDRYVLHGTGDAAWYQQELDRLLRRGDKPLAR